MINRRTLLQGGAITLGGLVFMPAQATIESAHAKGGKQLAMVIDLRRCNGCKACVVRCGHEHANEPDQHRTVVKQVAAPRKTGQTVLNLPLLCNHCDRPVCTNVCPTGATFKREEDGIVVVDYDKCIGCGLCVRECPYPGVRFIDENTRKVDKCNFCIHRTSKGLQPACVQTCTGSARQFGDINDPESVVSKLLEENKGNVHVLNPGRETLPNVYYIGLTDTESTTVHPLVYVESWER